MCFGLDLPLGTSIFPHDSWTKYPCSQASPYGSFLGQISYSLNVRGAKKNPRKVEGVWI